MEPSLARTAGAFGPSLLEPRVPQAPGAPAYSESHAAPSAAGHHPERRPCTLCLEDREPGTQRPYLQKSRPRNLQTHTSPLPRMLPSRAGTGRGGAERPLARPPGRRQEALGLGLGAWTRWIRSWDRSPFLLGPKRTDYFLSLFV